MLNTAARPQWPAAVSPLVAGELAGPRRAARVLGVFPTCIYLDMGEHDSVLAVLARDALLQPIGLRLGVSSAEVSWGVTAGDAVDVGEGRVRLARADVVAARVQRPARVRSLPLSGRVAPSSRAGGRSSGPRDVVGGVLVDRAHDLAAAALTGRPVASRLRALIGAGAGLTPSGDDAVAGVLLALRSAGRLDAVGAIDREVRTLSHLTTSISAALLRAAGQGYAVPEVVALVDLLAVGPAPWPAFRRVLAIGHSSGRDLVSGIAGARRALDAALDAAAEVPVDNHMTTRRIPQEGVLHG